MEQGRPPHQCGGRPCRFAIRHRPVMRRLRRPRGRRVSVVDARAGRARRFHGGSSLALGRIRIAGPSGVHAGTLAGSAPPLEPGPSESEPAGVGHVPTAEAADVPISGMPATQRGAHRCRLLFLPAEMLTVPLTDGTKTAGRNTQRVPPRRFCGVTSTSVPGRGLRLGRRVPPSPLPTRHLPRPHGALLRDRRMLRRRRLRACLSRRSSPRSWGCP